MGVLVLSFISVLLFQRSGHFCLFLTFYCVCVFFLLLFCRCFPLYYVVGSSGCVPPGIWCFTDFALASRAPSTFSTHFSSYNKWRSWAREHGLTVFPASPFHFAIYLRHLMTEAKTASPLESAVHSIAWFHQLGGEPSPSDHPLVKSIVTGA